MNPSTWLDSKLADTAPAIVGAAILLSIMLAFLWRMIAMQDRSTAKSAAVVAEAINKNTGALERLRDQDDARRERHYEVLKQLGESCQSSHAMQDRDHAHQERLLVDISAGVSRIEKQLGNA